VRDIVRADSRHRRETVPQIDLGRRAACRAPRSFNDDSGSAFMMFVVMGGSQSGIRIYSNVCIR